MFNDMTRYCTPNNLINKVEAYSIVVKVHSKGYKGEDVVIISDGFNSFLCCFPLKFIGEFVSNMERLKNTSTSRDPSTLYMCRNIDFFWGNHVRVERIDKILKVLEECCGCSLIDTEQDLETLTRQLLLMSIDHLSMVLNKIKERRNGHD